MKKYFYATFLLVCAFAAYFVFRPVSMPVDTAVIKRGAFNETLTGEGKVRSRDKRTVYAFANGNIENLTVKLGDVVKAGQVITRLNWEKLMQVTSPIDGVISKIYRESAGPIVRGEPIYEVSSLANVEVVVELLTPDAVRLGPDSKAKILNWGGMGELDAEIALVSRAGVVKTSALGVEEERTEVKLTFKDIPEQLKEKFGDNYHVDVAFQISQVANALIVPLGALFKANGSWAVYVVNQNNRAVLKKIGVSKRNDSQAEVTDGLNEGERVILFPSDKIREGSRVK